MTNFKKLPKIDDPVIMIREIGSGKNRPIMIPSKIAMKSLGTSPILCFIHVLLYDKQNKLVIVMVKDAAVKSQFIFFMGVIKKNTGCSDFAKKIGVEC